MPIVGGAAAAPDDSLLQASRFLHSDEAFQVVDEARELIAVSGEAGWRREAPA